MREKFSEKAQGETKIASRIRSRAARISSIVTMIINDDSIASMDVLHHSLADMFVLSLPWLEKIARPVVVYLLLIVLVRIFGKRELAQLNPFDLIVLLCLSNTLQNAIIGEDNSVSGGFIGAFSLLAINYATVRFLYRNPQIGELVEGSPTVLMEHGQVLQEALEKEVLTLGELQAVAHRQGFTGLEEIDKCILEPSGTFGVHPKEKKDHNAEIMAKLASIEKQLAALAAK